MAAWQAQPGNLEALSRESETKYVKLMHALELMREYCQAEDKVLQLAAPEQHGPTLAYVAAARFEGDSLPVFCDDAERGDFLRHLCDELLDALHVDLAERRPHAGDNAVLYALDPVFLPPDEPRAWAHWYEQLSSQIAREDELVNQRLLWMMQCEGFLFTAFGITLGAHVEPTPHLLKIAMLLLIPIVGFSGAFAVQRGVASAHRVLDSLKRAYLASLQRYKTSHVRPFGRYAEHRQLVSSMFPWIMMGAWALVLLCVVWLAARR
jgi:hypothetical protein